MNPRPVIALAQAGALDLLRRSSTRLIAVACVVAILSLRYFAAFGLGYEVVQLKELGIYTIGLFGALSALLFCLPRDDPAAEGAQDLLRTRPVSALVLSLGAYLGRLAVMTLLLLLWVAAICAALLWFKIGEPMLFNYRGADSVWTESQSLWLPAFGQWLVLAVLLALVQPLARLGKPMLTATGFLLLYVVGFSTSALGAPLNLLLPDLARYDLTETLWGAPAAINPIWLALHALAWCAVGLAADSATKG